MKVELNITGTAQACNEWTFATAIANGKEYRIMMVRFEEPGNSYERLFVKSCLQKNVKKVDNQRKMIPKRYAFVLLLFAFCNASAESDA